MISECHIMYCSIISHYDELISKELEVRATCQAAKPESVNNIGLINLCVLQ